MEKQHKKSPVKELSTNIKKLKDSFEEGQTFKRSFYLGIARGVGAAIGATVVAGLLVLLAQKLVSSAEDIPILNKFIGVEKVEVIIEKE
ncbi:MAG: DUF5665 domain-containing protein [Patescibacteria group bacterium]|nr:DUF5665 domain-containing protein [bacterium]MDZ4221535.1 DUF5665 domain-containing protein [Patescibacteria group bacterium]